MAIRKNFYEAEIVSGGCTYRIEAQPFNEEIPTHGPIELAVRLMEYDSSYDEYAVCVYASKWDTHSPNVKIEQRMPRDHDTPGQGLMRLYAHDARHLGNMFLIAAELASAAEQGALLNNHAPSAWSEFANTVCTSARYYLQEVVA